MPAPASLSTSTFSPLEPRARVEALLRERKLDRTLTTVRPGDLGSEALSPSGVAALDLKLGGGLPRGQVSEVVGPVSSGRTSLVWGWLAGVTARGESAALIDTFDRFDPLSGLRAGIDLTRLLWVRGQALSKTAGAIDPSWLPGTRAVGGPGTLLERTIDRALKALNLVLQSGVCTAVVLDFVDVPLAGLRRVPATTWMRLQRIVEGTDTVCVLMGAVPLARSAGGIAIETALSKPKGRSSPAASWAGSHDRARRLTGLSISMRLSSPRRIVQGSLRLETTTRHDASAVE